jgi:hypothetical protein
VNRFSRVVFHILILVSTPNPQGRPSGFAAFPKGIRVLLACFPIFFVEHHRLFGILSTRSTLRNSPPKDRNHRRLSSYFQLRPLGLPPCRNHVHYPTLVRAHAFHLRYHFYLLGIHSNGEILAQAVQTQGIFPIVRCHQICLGPLKSLSRS